MATDEIPGVPEGSIAFRYPPKSFIEAAFLQKLIAVQARGRDEPAEVKAGELASRPDAPPIIPETGWGDAVKLLQWWNEVVKKTRRGSASLQHPDEISSHLVKTMDDFAKASGFTSITNAATTAPKLDLPADGNAFLWVNIQTLALSVDSAKRSADAPGLWDTFVGGVENMPESFQNVINKVASGGVDATFFVARTLGGAIGEAGGAIIKGGLSGTVKVIIGVGVGLGVYKMFFADK